MIDWLINENGILLRRDAIAAGVDDNALQRAVNSGTLIRVRQGVYVLAAIWAQTGPVGQHGLLLQGVRLLYNDRVAASHISACLEQGGPNWGLDLSKVHLTNLDGKGDRSAAKVVHHRGACIAADITRDALGWITSPARTALDTACIVRQEAGVAVVDWYIQKGLATFQDMVATHERMREWPGTLGLHRILALADGKAESVGETRTRLVLSAQGLPPPIAQFEICHPSGRLAGRVDFAWPAFKLMLEFDGAIKYHRFRRTGETIEEMVIREKHREDTLRELTGWTMVRITWADLANPAALAARILRAMSLAA